MSSISKEKLLHTLDAISENCERKPLAIGFSPDGMPIGVIALVGPNSVTFTQMLAPFCIIEENLN